MSNQFSKCRADLVIFDSCLHALIMVGQYHEGFETMAIERVNELLAFRTFVDEELSKGSASLTFG